MVIMMLIAALPLLFFGTLGAQKRQQSLTHMMKKKQHGENYLKEFIELNMDCKKARSGQNCNGGYMPVYHHSRTGKPLISIPRGSRVTKIMGMALYAICQNNEMAVYVAEPGFSKNPVKAFGKNNDRDLVLKKNLSDDEDWLSCT